jgi:hypothetical protein
MAKKILVVDDEELIIRVQNLPDRCGMVGYAKEFLYYQLAMRGSVQS